MAAEEEIYNALTKAMRDMRLKKKFEQYAYAHHSGIQRGWNPSNPAHPIEAVFAETVRKQENEDCSAQCTIKTFSADYYFYPAKSSRVDQYFIGKASTEIVLVHMEGKDCIEVSTQYQKRHVIYFAIDASLSPESIASKFEEEFMEVPLGTIAYLPPALHPTFEVLEAWEAKECYAKIKEHRELESNRALAFAMIDHVRLGSVPSIPGEVVCRIAKYARLELNLAQK